MANPFEKPPILSPEESKKEKIEIVSEIGARKRTPEEIEKFKRIKEEARRDQEIREKLKRGELLTSKETARLRELELEKMTQAKKAEEVEVVEEKGKAKEEISKEDEERIIEKARQGEELSKEEKELLQEIKEKKVQEELKTELRELRIKKQRGETLSEEEVQRLEMLKLKWDIIQRAKERTEEKEIPKEVSLENLKKDLEEKRNVYVEADKEYQEKFGKMKKKELKVFEEAIGSAREHIKAGDSEVLKNEKSPQYSEAVKRKEDFIKELAKKGFKKEEVEVIYDVELKKAEYNQAKREYGQGLLIKRVEELKKEGKNEEEVMKLATAEIFQKLILEEREILNQAKIETWPPKEKNLFRKGLEWWMRRGTATRLLISTGLITGVVAVAGGFSAPAIALFAGQRFLRGAGAVLVSQLTGKGVDWAIEKGIKAKEEAALSELRKEFSLEKLKEVDKKYEKVLEEIAGKRRKKLIAKAGIMAATGAGTAIGLGWLEGYVGAKATPESSTEAPQTPPEPSWPKPNLEELSPEQLKELKERFPGMKYEIEAFDETKRELRETIHAKLEETIQAKLEPLPISERGPEGAIIDYFKANPEAAKTFGWDGKTDLSQWAGKKAHLLWLEEAKEALSKPETLEQLKKLGYSPDLEGYEQMMRRIGKGYVEFDAKTGKINLVETEYLKARIPSPETVQKTPTGTPPIEVPPVEVPPPPTEVPSEAAPVPEKLPSVDITEVVVKGVGFSEGEYNVIKGITVEKLLNEIPSEKEAWEIWRGEVEERSIDLPHHGVYWWTEFKRHIKLAEIIRASKPSPEQLKLTIEEYLRNFPGKKLSL